jgi:hypothetical protein
MKKDMDEETARELLRRLDGVLGDVEDEDDDDLFGDEDDDLPSPEEARAELERAGIDPEAALARLHARIAAFDRGAGVPGPDDAPPAASADPAPVAGNPLPPPSTTTSGEAEPRRPPPLQAQRAARKRRLIVGAGAVMAALAAGVSLWWIARPEESADFERPALFQKRRSAAEPSPAPSLSADLPDAGTAPSPVTPGRERR